MAHLREGQQTVKEEEEERLGGNGRGRLVLYSPGAKVRSSYLITILLLGCHNRNGQVASS